MQHDFTKSERKKIRQLASLAWERKLRVELRQIAGMIAQMDSGDLSPFDVNDRIHQFHNGISHELYNQYSGSQPWFSVCRAHFDGVLTDDDIANASEEIREGIRNLRPISLHYINSMPIQKRRMIHDLS